MHTFCDTVQYRSSQITYHLSSPTGLERAHQGFGWPMETSGPLAVSRLALGCLKWIVAPAVVKVVVAGRLEAPAGVKPWRRSATALV